MKYLIPILILLAVGCQPTPKVPIATSQASAASPVVTQPLTHIHGKKIKETYNAKCVGVVDGDTIDVLTAENRQVRIRLDSIDSPEKRRKQAFGSQAKEHMSSLVFGQKVTIYRTGMHFERQVAFVLANDVDVCAAMIRDGFAWNSVAYSKSEALVELEIEAREAKRGLWASDVEPIPPWEFRKK